VVSNDPSFYYNGYNTSPVNFTLATSVFSTATTTIVPDSMVSGQLANPGDVQRYTFNLSEPTTLLMDSQPGDNGNLWFKLTGPDGVVSSNTFQGQSDYGSLAPFRLAAGSYTIEVYGNDTQTGTFGFDLLSLAQATTTAADGTLSGTLP